MVPPALVSSSSSSSDSDDGWLVYSRTQSQSAAFFSRLFIQGTHSTPITEPEEVFQLGARRNQALAITEDLARRVPWQFYTTRPPTEAESVD